MQALMYTLVYRFTYIQIYSYMATNISQFQQTHTNACSWSRRSLHISIYILIYSQIHIYKRTYVLLLSIDLSPKTRVIISKFPKFILVAPRLTAYSESFANAYVFLAECALLFAWVKRVNKSTLTLRATFC